MYNNLCMAVCSRFKILKIWIVLKHHILIFQNLTKININIRIYTSTATRLNIKANSNKGNMSHMYVTKQYKQYQFSVYVYLVRHTKNPQFNIHLGNKTKLKFNVLKNEFIFFLK